MTSQQMDDEPYEEVMRESMVMYLDSKRDKREQQRAEHANAGRGGL